MRSSCASRAERARSFLASDSLSTVRAEGRLNELKRRETPDILLLTMGDVCSPDERRNSMWRGIVITSFPRMRKGERCMMLDATVLDASVFVGNAKNAAAIIMPTKDEKSFFMVVMG